MNEPAVTLTDFGLTILCIICSWKLWAAHAERKELNLSFSGFFLSAAVASFLGAFVHGFIPQNDIEMNKIFWESTLIAVGVTAYNLWQINLRLVMSDALLKLARNITRGLLGLYVLVVLFYIQEFYVAILSYIPPVIILFLIVIMRVARNRDKFDVMGLVGIALTFGAAYVQQAHIVIHPVYFDHNALYHVLQGCGLVGIYFFGSRLARRNE